MALSISSFNSRRIYISLAVSAVGVLVIFALNIFIYFANYEQEMRKSLIDNFWLQKVKPAKKYDMVFIGDSRCYRGVAVAPFEKELGLSVLNSGLSSGGHNMEMYNHVSNHLLKNAQDKARIVVLCLTHHSMTYSARNNEHLKSLIKKSKENSIIKKYSEILFQKEIRKRLKKTFKKKPFISNSIYHEHGWCETLEKVTESSQKEGLEIYKATYKKTQYAEESLAELAAYTKRCRQENIAVFAFVPPTTPDMKKLEETYSGCDMGRVRSAFAKAGGVWIDIEDEDKYSAYDSSHLPGEQAVVLSGYLSRKIKEKL